MPPKLLTFTFLLMLCLGVNAHPPADSTDIKMKVYMAFRDSVNSVLKYKTGKITPEGGHVELNVPDGFKFLNKEQTVYVLTDLWGNPKSAADKVVGMIFPKDSGPMEDSSYAFVVTYSEIGYVKDEDAEKINYDDLLKEIQKDEPAVNEERKKQGYPSMHIVGWAQKPFYDSKNKVLHWAKEIEFGSEGNEENTLNYDVRILGRKGILELNAVGKMYDLPKVNKDIANVLTIARFTDGNSYHDFKPGLDNVAAWTIGGLVAGKILAKVGLWAVLGKFFIAAWKFIVIGFIAAGAWIKKLLGIRKKNAPVETNYETSAPAENTPDEADVEGTAKPVDGEVPAHPDGGL